MGLLVKPYLGCNLKCKYCYENEFRDVKPPEMDYNLEAVLKRIRECKDEKPEIGLHGGEILMLPNKDLERLLSETYKHKKKTSIQTNATLIDDEKIKLFKKYKTNVGISWDGPGELCDFRPGTKKVGKIIDRLLSEGVGVGMIVVVSKANAGTKEKRKKLKNFLIDCRDKGIDARFNPCYGSSETELPPGKRAEIYLEFAKFCVEHGIFWSPFTDIIARLRKSGGVCVYRGCDIFCTESAMSVMGDGSLTNCMRTNKEYILLRDSKALNTRDDILQNTPQKYGGCEGCKYFENCRGGCPTSAIDDDWRNRTRWCDVWFALFSYFNNVMKFAEFGKKEENNANPRWEKKGYSDHTDKFI